jgi:hypothetical protein
MWCIKTKEISTWSMQSREWESIARVLSSQSLRGERERERDRRKLNDENHFSFILFIYIYNLLLFIVVIDYAY